jgi:hypothetical protein
LHQSLKARRARQILELMRDKPSFQQHTLGKIERVKIIFRDHR